MNRPSFVIVGAQKAGTTSLHHFLSQHPEIFMSRRKELHFFDRRSAPTPRGLNAYLAHFRHAKSRQLCGESTPIYMFYPGALERLREALGPIKILILLRNPIARAYSHYWHEIGRGWEYLPFAQAIERPAPRRWSEIHVRHHSYVPRGLYSAQIRLARELFGEGNVEVVKFEEMVVNPLATANHVLRHISPRLEPLSALAVGPRNRAMVPRSRALHGLIARTHLAARRRLLPHAVMRLNLARAPYRALSAPDHRRCRDYLLERDPALVDIYPELARD